MELSFKLTNRWSLVLKLGQIGVRFDVWNDGCLGSGLGIGLIT
jgi:hypothetical protein